MAELMRQKVEQPFALGVSSQGTPSKKLDLSSTALPRSAFQAEPQTGEAIVESLIGFAGVAGSEYVKNVNVKLEADKALQMTRAAAGMVPSSETTVAGYRAHAAVNIQNVTLKSKIDLDTLAKTRVSTEDWEKAVEGEYLKMDAYMTGNYPTYKTDIEMQKLASVAFREMIPSATLTREDSKIKFEIEDRINSATDSLVLASKSNAAPDELNSSLVNTLGALKLTESEKDKAIVNAIGQTRSTKLIELSKTYKGERGTSLYDRTGAIQKLERQIAKENLSYDMIAITMERRGAEDLFLSGDLTEDEFIKIAQRRNNDLQGKFMSGSQLESALDTRQKLMLAEGKGIDVMKTLADPNTTNYTTIKKKEVQQGLEDIYTAKEEKAAAESANITDEAAKKAFIDNKRKANKQEVADLGVKGGAVLDSMVADLNNLANLNIPATILEGDVGKFKIEQLPEVAQRGIETFDSLSVTALDDYYEALGAREAKLLKNFNHLRDMGSPLPQALDKAQKMARNPEPYNAQSVSKGTEAVRSKQEFSWFRPDFPSNQEGYLEEAIREKVALDPSPDSDRNVEAVSRWMANKWTTAGKIRLKGSQGELQNYMGLNVDKLEFAMEAVINSQRSKILPMIEGLGLKIEDVFPVTDTKLRTIQLRTSNGDWVGAPIPMSEVRGMSNKWKVEQEKIASEHSSSALSADKTGLDTYTKKGSNLKMFGTEATEEEQLYPIERGE